MTWRPLASSGLVYTFDPHHGESLVESTVSATGAATSAWELAFSAPAGLRITVVSYLTTDDTPPAAKFVWNGGEAVNVSGSESVWAPAVMVVPTGDGVGYIGSVGDESYVVTLETDYVAPYETLGRTSRQYVSGYSLAGTQQMRVNRFQKRLLVADFNGAIPVGDTIASVAWRCNAPWITVLGEATVANDGRATAVWVSFNAAGGGSVKCTATTAGGSVYEADWYVAVFDVPWYGEQWLSAGPTLVTALI